MQKLRFAVLIGLAAIASGAGAAVGDGPYFSLWEKGTGLDTPGYQGDGASISLCGNAGGCSGLAGDGVGIFSVAVEGAAGSGHIRPFLRFAHTEKASDGTYQVYPNDTGTGASAGVEAAYNTSAGSHTSDLQGRSTTGPDRDFINQAKDAPGSGPANPTGANYAVKLSDFLDVGGFFEFWLDINEPNGGEKELLRMDELKIFIANTDSLNNFDPNAPDPNSDTTPPVTGMFETAAGTQQKAVKVWDMDYDQKIWGDTSGSNNKGDGACAGMNSDNPNYPGCGGVTLNNQVGTGGSGDLDYRLQLKKSLFDAALSELGDAASADTTFVYLYNFAGGSNTKNNADGSVAEANFEEWRFRATPDSTSTGGGPGVPEPATALLLGAGLLGLLRRRTMSRA